MTYKKYKFSHGQTFHPKKKYKFGLGPGCGPKPRIKINSEFHSIHFGIEINKPLKLFTPVSFWD